MRGYDVERFWSFLYSDKGSVKRRCIWVLASVPILLSLYVLSVGPAVRIAIAADSPAAYGIVDRLYDPLRVVYESVPPLQGPLDWYIELWD